MKLLLGIGALLLLLGCQQTKQVQQVGVTSADSPVKIRGGSIHAENPLDTWTETTQYKAYWAKVPHNDNNYIAFNGLTDASENSATTISATSGWMIEYSNQDADQNEKWKAMFVCSSQSCDGHSFDSQGHVYVKTDRGDVKLELVNGHDEVHFHDISSPRCDDYPSSNRESLCDKPKHILVSTSDAHGNVTTKTYHCNRYGAENCVITIGKN